MRLPVIADMLVLSDDRTVPRTVAPSGILSFYKIIRLVGDRQNYHILAFPKQYYQITILYTLASYFLLNERAETDGIEVGL